MQCSEGGEGIEGIEGSEGSEGSGSISNNSIIDTLARISEDTHVLDVFNNNNSFNNVENGVIAGAINGGVDFMVSASGSFEEDQSLFGRSLTEAPPPHPLHPAADA